MIKLMLLLGCGHIMQRLGYEEVKLSMCTIEPDVVKIRVLMGGISILISEMSIFK